MTKLTDAQRRDRWCTIRLRRAEDLTPYDIIRWNGQWTEIFGVYRDAYEWAAEFRLISSFPDGEDPGYLDQRKAAESALDADDLVVIRVIDRERSEPGCIEDTLLVRYRYELIETQDLPAQEPEARADPGALNQADLECLATTAVELWEEADDETGGNLSSRQQEVLARARTRHYQQMGVSTPASPEEHAHA